MRWRVVWHDRHGFQCRDFGSKTAAETHESQIKRTIDNPDCRIIPPTLAMLAREACDVQNACNLSGVVRTYAEVLSALRDLPECTGNAWLHSHPIAIAFADKIASLTGIQYFNATAIEAHNACGRLVERIES